MYLKCRVQRHLEVITVFVFLTLVVIAVIIKAPSGLRQKRRSRISLHTGLKEFWVYPSPACGA